MKDLQKHLVKYFNKNYSKKEFIPGKSLVPVAGKVFDENELFYGVQAILDGWWTEGHFAQEFEKKFKSFLGVRFVSLTNSGSSANLLALLALTSKSLGEKAIKVGDEIITVAAAFPTTVNPIIITGCVPVFVDIDLKTGNIKSSDIKKALSNKTRAIMIAHTLGNPFNVKEVLKIAKENNLWVIEDCCDALGSKYNNKFVGTFGDVATFSFYPAHHITMGEGGAVVTNNPFIHRSIRQFRDWGRDCWCNTGEDDTCRKRFGWKFGELPLGFDHKYIYSQIGYNLKLTDMQAAIGVAQLEKLAGFIKKRKENFKKLYFGFQKFQKYLVLPEWEKEADPSWFGFMLSIKENSFFKRLDLVSFLEERKIATRTLFAGNILRHPGYLKINHRRIGNLKNTDKMMNYGFWIGVYPGITSEMIDYILITFNEFFKKLP